MQTIVRLAVAALTATPLAAVAATATPLPEQLALAADAETGVGSYAATNASKRARYASLTKQAEGLCRIYQGQARVICVGEARMKFAP